MYEWLNQHHLTVPSSSATAKAINYSLKRWQALCLYLDDGNLPIDMRYRLSSQSGFEIIRPINNLFDRQSDVLKRHNTDV